MQTMKLPFRNTFKHGVHPPEHKLTASMGIKELPFPDKVILPLNMHIGIPSKPIVRDDEEVYRGQVVATKGGNISVPIHSPVTGKVLSVSKYQTANGLMSQCIIIETDQASSQTISKGDVVNWQKMLPDEIIAAIQEAGLVGMGGASFPTHVKLSVPKDQYIDCLVINAAECEPYISADHRYMLEKPDMILLGCQILMKALSIKQVVIGIESNKADAIEMLKDSLSQKGDLVNQINLITLPVKYPQGSEKMLVHALLGRQIPAGKLPIEAHVLIQNVSTVGKIAEYFSLRIPFIERVVTVIGDGIDKPGNYRIPIGTPLYHILGYCGMKDDIDRVIFGGPMMGQPVPSFNVPIQKGTSGIIVTRNSFLERKKYACISCGSCVDACPMFLNPSFMAKLALVEDYENIEKAYYLFDCFECGSCSYVCPSNIPLVQIFRYSKNMIRTLRGKV